MVGFKMFKIIKKGVDTLHIPNHIHDGCKREYPKVIAQLREDFLAPNTQSGEQTFVWFGKFQKILNNMPKTRHHFMVHMLVRARNDYTDWCYSQGLKPKLPQARGGAVMVAPSD